MYKMRDSWTDERLDDFRDEVNRRFDKLEERFESTHRLLVHAVVGIASLVLAGYAASAAVIAILA
jgi:hypothetical protein